MERRIITTEFTSEDTAIENNLRPEYLMDYVGQEKIKQNLKNSAHQKKIHRALGITHCS